MGNNFKAPFLSPLSYVILTLHVAILYTLLFSKGSVLDFKTKKILVHTVHSKPKGEKVNTKSSPVKKTSSPPKKSETLSKKKENLSETKKNPSVTKKDVVKKAPAPQKPQVAKPISKEPPPSATASIIAELEERIAKIEGNHDKVSESRKKGTISSDKVIAPIEKLTSFDEMAPPADISDDIIGFLHESLQLPDFGKVKVKLTLTPSGMIKQVVVLESESELNKKYLEERLPGLCLPITDRSFFKASEKTIIVNFCNEL